MLEYFEMANAASKFVLNHYEAAVDEIIASCNGDMRGAVKALMLINEQLEQQLQQLHDNADAGSPREMRFRALLH